MVNVTNRADIAVRLSAFKLFLGHRLNLRSGPWEPALLRKIGTSGIAGRVGVSDFRAYGREIVARPRSV
jgi:hypothetical protein